MPVIHLVLDYFLELIPLATELTEELGRMEVNVAVLDLLQIYGCTATLFHNLLTSVSISWQRESNSC